MFGYVQINQPELKMKDYEMYRSYYCGLCHTLHKRYGRKGQFLLNYDMTFLAILLGGLYEEQELTEKRRCVPHPVAPHPERISAATEYAADMTVLLAWQKALDDWKDERSALARAQLMLLHRDYRMLRSRYPRQAKTLERCVRELSACEKSGCRDLDRVSGLTGQFMAQMFVWKDDVWQEDLRTIGFYLGKFIYLMDAYDDLEKDIRHGSYNILREVRDSAPEQFDEKVRALLEDMMTPAALAFERLPIIRCADIDRNILYSGVWVKCAAVRKERELRQKSGRGKKNEGSAGKADEVRK